MSDLEQKHEDHSSDEAEYRYRWSYAEQAAFDQKIKKKKKRNGAVVYAVVMVVFFLLCFAMLAGTIALVGLEPGPGAEGSATEVSERVLPATVLIYCTNNTSYSYGTGFFVREDGYIATNCHVIDGYTTVRVTLYSGKEYDAEVVGYHRADDIAVLKISGRGFPTVTIGDSDTLRVGERAIAIGNPAGANAPWTTTQGIISALNREVTVNESSSIEELTMIQTDAQVNPGNSGGPLLNAKGEVIGIVTRKLTDYEGIGLALPINGSMKLVNAIIEKGNADDVESGFSKSRPTIGITGSTIEKGTVYTYGGAVAPESGVLVATVDSTGAAAGILREGDIIIEIDGKRVTTIDELINTLYSRKAGDTVRLRFYRDGELMEASVKLGSSSAKG